MPRGIKYHVGYLCHTCKKPLDESWLNSTYARKKKPDYRCLICINKYRRDRNKTARAKVIAYYGGKCACCGESAFEFLTIDHINNNGSMHRKELKLKSSGFVNWIIKNNFEKK